MRASLLQFPDQKVRIRFHARVRDRDAARAVIEACARDGGLLVFTIVSPELREFIHQVCYEKKVEAVDVIGALLGKLSSFLDSEPLCKPSASLPLSEEYFRRIEAVEFAVKNDDGKEPRNLKKADLILAGVSRTSKTPLSTYLANRGIKVANVPLVLGVAASRKRSTRCRKTASSASPSASISSVRSAARGSVSSACRRTPTTASASTCARSSTSRTRSSSSTPRGPWST